LTENNEEDYVSISLYKRIRYVTPTVSYSSNTGIVGSDLVMDIVVCLYKSNLYGVYVVECRQESLGHTDPSSKKVIPHVSNYHS
jgi:hypothetical protein